MAKETERKFLVCSDSWRGEGQSLRMMQGYVGKGRNCVFRVRIAGERAWLTIKARRDGISGDEFEYEIPCPDARTMLENHAESGIIDKIRHYILYEGMTWELDEFLGENSGLLIAEIELPYPDCPFSKPDWLGDEVSLDPRYTNHYLAAHPYSGW
ncbi:MAG: CYTH domain-containing protein [Desulfovibrionaceae bacterium]|nr:CYTH domain-containing protein [Desulfovibrionaceae bacterium]